MISKNISYKEATQSNTALRLGINNEPDGYQLGNMSNIANNLFQPLREWVGGPIKINSFFRCEELNEAIGGSPRSQHCQGRAMDLDDIHGHKSIKVTIRIRVLMFTSTLVPSPSNPPTIWFT